jgi:hypothetical protein
MVYSKADRTTSAAAGLPAQFRGVAPQYVDQLLPGSWVVRYPDMVKRAAPIAGTAKNTIHDSLFTETLVEAITSDLGFNNGFYASSADVREGMLRHAKMNGLEHRILPAKPA